MAYTMDRRHLLGVTLLLAATPLKAQSLWDWLSSPETPARLHGILIEHLQLSADHLHLMPDFIRRLKTRGLATEHPERFRSWLQNPTAIQELAAYIVEEFVIASNYFAWKSGEEKDLCILSHRV